MKDTDDHIHKEWSFSFLRAQSMVNFFSDTFEHFKKEVPMESSGRESHLDDPTHILLDLKVRLRTLQDERSRLERILPDLQKYHPQTGKNYMSGEDKDKWKRSFNELRKINAEISHVRSMILATEAE